MPWTWAWELDSEAEGSLSGYWEGAAHFFDGNVAKAREVSVVFRPDGLEIPGGEAFGAGGLFGSGDFTVLEKHPSGLLRLELSALPGSVLEFRDPEAVRWIGDLEPSGRRMLPELSLPGKAAALLALLAAVGAFMYFIGLDLAVEGAMRVLPHKVDRMLGGAVAEQFAKKVLVPEDSLVRTALAHSAAAVMGMGGDGTDSIRILVVPDTSVKNAFAFPGGTLVVYTGMIRLLDDEEEWLGLLAHESGHVFLRHGMRSIVRGSILGVGMSLMFGDVSGIGAVVMDNAGTLLRLKFGRREEAAADAYACGSLAAAGRSPEGLARLLRKLMALEKQPGWAAFLSTHPATRDRIAAIENGPFPPFSQQAAVRTGERAPGARGERSRSTPGNPEGERRVLTPEEWAALRAL